MIKKNKEKINNWKKKTSSTSTRNYSFDTVSGKKVKLSYFPNTLNQEYIDNLGMPGEYPYTRGIHSNLYRGRLWTMRQFSGFGSPSETNKRFKYLLKHGKTGLSVAFDMPTLMGYDCDHEISEGEVGHC